MATSLQMYRFKDITVVPPAGNLIDVVLSKTQRKTPTVVHPQFKITRIRRFYMRKVKFCQQTIHDKLSAILTEFPRLDDIHPFYADLANVLYDRDHYKLALGQCNAVRGVCDNLAKDYVRLLKYSDSNYKCKMLKRAALGRMCTAIRKLKGSLSYLEEVRQHLSRLPTINPSTRSLILTGYPNVGKSSFMNIISNANVEVQPYAFTTRSLYVGHFDHDYTRWQVIDTPGILDHPMENRNTIELQAITALAHIQAAVLYFLDLSEACGYSLSSQVALFHEIKALFKSKPIVIVLNKIDTRKVSDLTEDEKELIKSMATDLPFVEYVPTSCLTHEGVDTAKNKAADRLLEMRVQRKVESKKAEGARVQLTIVTPQHPVNEDVRGPSIPDSVMEVQEKALCGEKEMQDWTTERELEEIGGGPGVYGMDERKRYILDDPTWKYDILPEIMDGKNIADFVDPDIEAKVMALEKEEALLLAENPDDLDNGGWEETQKILNELHKKIREKRLTTKFLSPKQDLRRSLGGHGPRDQVEEVKEILGSLGYQTDGIVARAKPARRLSMADYYDDSDSEEQTVGRKRKLSVVSNDCMSVEAADAADGDEWENMEPSEKTAALKKGSRKRLKAMSQLRVQGAVGDIARAKTLSKIKMSIPDKEQQVVATKREHRSQKRWKSRKGEADRWIPNLKPKWLLSGKMSNGKRDWR